MSTWFAPNFRLLFTPFENKIQSFSQPIPKLHAVHWQHMVTTTRSSSRRQLPPTFLYLADALVLLLLVTVIGINIHGQLPAHYTMISSALYQIRSQTIKAFFSEASLPCRQLVNGVISCFLYEKDKCLPSLYKCHRKLCSSM